MPDDPTPTLDWLFGRQRFGIRPGLERTRLLLEAAGRPERDFESVLVGGTNGKGSTVATLSSALRAGGRRVGAFVSPHLLRLGERIAVDGEAATLQRLSAEIERLRPAAERSGATFFEVLFAAGCRIFADSGVEIAVMEVGLGGTYDATNALSPRLSILTNVALDHQAVLGDTVEAIAADKSGILRPGRPAFTGARGAALAVIEERAAALGAPLTVLGRDLGVRVLERGWLGSSVRVDLGSRVLELHTPLLGAHQADNVALAVAAAAALGVPESALRRGVTDTRWPGRLEPLDWGGRRLLLDGAHNPAAAAALADTLTGLDAGPLVWIVGVSADKDLAGIAAALSPRAERVVATRASLSPRALPAEDLAARIGADAWENDPARALERAAALAPDATLLVAGSLFLVAEVRALALGIALDPYPRWQ